jgi:rubrerythrin
MEQDFTLRESIQLAITTEQLGREYYNRMAGKFKDHKDVVDIFTQLAKDEQTHEEQFKKILENVPQEENTPERYELYQYMRATAISEFFQKDYFKKIAGIDEPTEALVTALNFEKATLQFYKAMREVMGEHKQLDAIIGMERNHVLALVRIIPTDAKFRGLGDSY